MGELLGIGAVASVVAAFGTILGVLLRAMHRDRASYEDAIDRAEKRADAADLRALAARVAEDAARARQHAAEDALRLRGGGG